MAANDSFAALMARLRSGADDAAREVFERYTRRLRGLARGRIGTLLAQKVDPEDVVQSVYKSFFLRQREGKFQIDNWDGLWGLLTVITLRKCADRAEYFRAGRRDAAREEGAEAGDLVGDREPSPHEAAVLAETVEELFRSAGEDERPVLELSLQGYSAAEISAQLGRAERTVRRLRERTRKRLEQMRG